MPEEVTFLDRKELLTFEEITRFVRIGAPLGIDKIRLTGGEPLMRRDLPPLVAMLVAIPGIKDVGLTTNGILLPTRPRRCTTPGCGGSTSASTRSTRSASAQLTRRDGLEQGARRHPRRQAGRLRARSRSTPSASAASPSTRSCRWPASPASTAWRCASSSTCRSAPTHWERDKVYFAHEILEQLEREVGPLVPADDYDPRAPAMEFRYTDGGGRVGIIASVSRPFCLSCNRVRLTADGKLRNCLFALDEVDVKAPAARRRAPTRRSPR